jgi:hypothetical protein
LKAVGSQHFAITDLAEKQAMLGMFMPVHAGHMLTLNCGMHTASVVVVSLGERYRAHMLPESSASCCPAGVVAVCCAAAQQVSACISWVMTLIPRTHLAHAAQVLTTRQLPGVAQVLDTRQL